MFLVSVMYLWKTDCFWLKSFYLNFVNVNTVNFRSDFFVNYILSFEIIIPLKTYDNVKKDRFSILKENSKNQEYIDEQIKLQKNYILEVL